MTTVLTALILLAAVEARAQRPARVSGRVADQTGAALPGVAVDLVVGAREWTTRTDGAGIYRFEDVAAGNGEVTYRLLNFTVLRRTVTIGTGAAVTADAVLTLALSADVLVTGASTFRSIADVEDPSANLVGIAAAASQGAVAGAALEARPVMRAGEVLETVPGLIVSQHSGEGKANQYYLRGFNLDHGTDFSTTVAGVPVNTPTGAHAHGYADVSFLIPELVSGVQFKKGPYFAALNSGRGSATLLSPKAGAILGPWKGTEVYLNAGTGFHSNDARGAAITVDPVTGSRADRVTPLVRARGAEIGLRTVRLRGLQSTLALWYLGLDSELLFVGDAGTTEPGRPSHRAGLEWTNYIRLRPWLTVDADLAFSRARFTDAGKAGSRIPGALDRVISAGVTIEPRQPLFGSLRVRHFGPRPLNEDASVTSRSTTLWNGEIGYQVSKRTRFVREAFNILDAEVSDIDYFYTSRLAGEPEGGVAGLHTHPVPPRTLRFGLHLTF